MELGRSQSGRAWPLKLHPGAAQDQRIRGAFQKQLACQDMLKKESYYAANEGHLELWYSQKIQLQLGGAHEKYILKDQKKEVRFTGQGFISPANTKIFPNRINLFPLALKTGLFFF